MNRGALTAGAAFLTAMLIATGGPAPAPAETLLVVSAGGAVRSAGDADDSIERILGVYLQQAIELATVGTRTVLLTRMTRFRRCGRGRGTADEFNGHLVEVVGREVPGFGFVAGLVNTVEGCMPESAGEHDHDR
ncbi:MAG TPA: hypothetical protein VGZ23_15230 [bacterium]|nr:hypothetical protein [bacterium]